MHVGVLDAPRPFAEAVVPLPLCAANVESCCVLRALPHFGQLTRSLFDSTSFSYSVLHSSQMYS